MKFSFHPEAVDEFNSAIGYYEESEKGLGIDFTIEVHAVIERILAHPLAWTAIDNEIRRCLVPRFPYGILYSVESEEIYILAVMNLHREPDSWKTRL